MKKRNNVLKNGVLIAAFGAGLLMACFLPAKFLVGILAAVVIILGIFCAKCS